MVAVVTHDVYIGVVGAKKPRGSWVLKCLPGMNWALGKRDWLSYVLIKGSLPYDGTWSVGDATVDKTQTQ